MNHFLNLPSNTKSNNLDNIITSDTGLKYFANHRLPLFLNSATTTQNSHWFGNIDFWSMMLNNTRRIGNRRKLTSLNILGTHPSAVDFPSLIRLLAVSSSSRDSSWSRTGTH
jgi:hypothetical protein